MWAQIEAKDIYYLFPFNFESNDTKNAMVPNGNLTIWVTTLWYNTIFDIVRLQIEWE